MPAPGDRPRPTCPSSRGRDLGPMLSATVRHGNRRGCSVLDHQGGTSGPWTPYSAAAPADVAEPGRSLPETLGYLLFTSGTTGTPKAVQCTQGRLMRSGAAPSITTMFGLQRGQDVVVSEPCRCSTLNALLAGILTPGIERRGAHRPAQPARLSSVGLQARRPDLRRRTFFNYVGKPLAYILATPEQPDDAENPMGGGGVRQRGQPGRHRWPPSPAASDAEGHRRIRVLGRRARPSPARPSRRRPRSARLNSGRRHHRPERRRTECPPARFDDQRPSPQRRRGDRPEYVANTVGGGLVRGLLQQPRGRRRARIARRAGP